MSSLLFGNGTNIVHWKPSSDTRSTSDILSTCIITMLLCVWTAVHLNVSPPGKVWTSGLRKVGWMIMALLAPEILAYTAWYVYSSRKLLLAKSTNHINYGNVKFRILIMDRYQRRQALGTMRLVNETFVLPNPPSFLSTAVKGIKSVISGLRKALSSHNREPVRVSRS